ncbi:hypothetical protein Tcan_00366 [Toxocara canis]|uniref:Uncharacterized protein n=1 Tax=Toxocara canis TaxID=6265 RepID=A0A0B2V5T0_TOXCA|nr:hypothetical protein Tcan_00366 [Toxocara canis]
MRKLFTAIMLKEKRIVFNNRISGACETSVQLINDGHDYLISAGVATSLTVNTAKMPLNHIAYAMYTWSGHRPSRCISKDGYSHCFCRSYERGVACNDGISEVKVAVRQAYKSLLVENRKTYIPELTLAERTGKETCRQMGSVAIIQYNTETGNLDKPIKCLY